MSSLDPFKDPISSDSPCGESPDIFEAEQFLVQIPVDADAHWKPDWTAINKSCQSLLKEKKSITLAILLALARMHQQGLPGFAEAMQLLSHWLDTYWNSLHPVLDPEETAPEEQAFERLNNLRSLSSPGSSQPDAMRGSGDYFAVCDRLTRTPLCRTDRFPGFSLRQVLLARGEQSPEPGEEGESWSSSQIENAFAELAHNEPDVMARELGAAQSALEALASMESLLAEKVGNANVPSFHDIKNTLQKIEALLAASHGGETITDTEAEETLETTETKKTMKGFSGSIETRQDALRAMEAIQKYYQRHEPSSPVPLMLARAQKFAELDFFDLVNEMAPDAKERLEIILGTRESSDSD